MIPQHRPMKLIVAISLLLYGNPSFFVVPFTLPSRQRSDPPGFVQVQQPQSPQRRRYPKRSTTSAIRDSSSSTNNNNNSFDYEYIPPRTAEDGRRSNLESSSSSSLLTSTYPPGTPAGLRGEAIRSAIRSSLIGWNFQNTIYECGVVQVTTTTTSSSSSTSAPLLTFLNGKFSQSISLPPTTTDSSTSSLYTETSFLNSKGQIIDRISIAIPGSSTSAASGSTAYLLTSPGHGSQRLFQQLDPYIFPMDQIQLHPKTSASSSFLMFHLLSSEQQSVQDCYTRYILSQLPLSNRQLQQYQTLPSRNECIDISFTALDERQMTLLILPSAGLPTCAGYGYTFCFWSESSSSPTDHIGHTIWQYVISEQCADGPIEIGTLEYDTLRIECGQPLYHQEMTATVTKQKLTTTTPATTTTTTTNTVSGSTPASPLELGLEYTIFDTSSSLSSRQSKGCYQGQEGIASILKNPRGPPRTLYQVIFDDDTNIYDYQSEGEYTSRKKEVENLTRTPRPNDTLYVLGSNEEIMVGRLTSVAEPSGTGEPITIALALVRRSDSILSSMQQMGIDRPSRLEMIPLSFDDRNVDSSASILIPPPPIDVLDGLEVIVGGTYTIGTLRMIPSRRSKGRTKFLFSDEEIPTFVKNLPSEQDSYDLVPLTKLQKNDDDDDDYNDDRNAAYGTTPEPKISRTSMIPNVPNTPSIVDRWDDEADGVNDTASNLEQLQEDDEKVQELERAIVEAEEAAQEAQRKAAKLELLRQRAEEAMARRKLKQQPSEQN